jgi:hypothetical protein
MQRRLRLHSRLPSTQSILRGYGMRQFTQSTTLPPRVVGAGEAKSSTPVPPPPPAWYKQPKFVRSLINIFLLASFANSAAIILSYKSQKREILWRSKERIQTLRETIERVRKGEPVDIRAALGTQDPEMEKRWTEGTNTQTFSFSLC